MTELYYLINSILAGFVLGQLLLLVVILIFIFIKRSKNTKESYEKESHT